MSHSSYTGCGSVQVDSTVHPSISMPLGQQQHAVHGLLPGPHTHVGFDAGLTMAAAAAQGTCQLAGHSTWAPELDCSPHGYCSSDGSTGQVPYTPGSASSCVPQLDFAALQAMQQSISGPASVNMQAWSSAANPQGKRNSAGSGITAAPAATAARCAAPAPAGAFGYQCAPVSMARAPAQDRLASFTANSSSTLYAAGGSSSGSFTNRSPTGLRTSSMTGNSFTYPAAGGAGWQQLLPGCVSGNSISSNSSGSFAVDAQAFQSPTNVALAAQQNTAPTAVALQPSTYPGVPAQLPVANQEQQLLPDAPAGSPVHGTQQQQHILLPLAQRQQQQQQVQQQQVAAPNLGTCSSAPGPVTATAAAAAAAVPSLAEAAVPPVAAVPELDINPSLGGMASATLESINVSDDFDGIADLFDSDGPHFDDDTLGPDVFINDVDGNDFEFGGLLDCAGVELGEGFDVSQAEVDTLKREFDFDW
jgi:hypothetical protein